MFLWFSVLLLIWIALLYDIHLTTDVMAFDMVEPFYHIGSVF